MKFGIPERRTITVKAILFSLGLVALNMFNLYYQGGWFAIGFVLISFAVLLLPFVIGQGLRKENKDKPLFEITGDKLLIKGDLFKIAEYPLSGFNGVIKTQRRIFQQYLDAPGFKNNRWNDHILISGLPQKERELFLKELQKTISGTLNNSVHTDAG